MTLAKRTAGTGRFAVLVAAGILLSRIAGLARLRVFAHYFGLRSEAADAFNAAFRIPNFLQNMFGEGVLSASFIPVYAGLLAEKDEREAGRVAGAVFGALSLVVATLVLAGVLATPLLIDAIAPGFDGAQRALAIELVRILFPGAGILALSAWCLGILNSHGRFFLSYTAPVIWNAAMIAALVGFGGRLGESRLAVALAWGSVAGSALQFGIQLPAVLRLARGARPALDTASAHVRTVIRNFVPAFIGRGVVQISAYIDALLASLLPTGALTGITNAQLLYTLPISLFGMSVSAAELPAMSGAAAAGQEAAGYLRQRLDTGLRRIAFFIVAATAGFLALGDVVAAALFQTGRFTHADAVYVWGILAGAAIRLPASTLGRLYASAWYALRDTRTPLNYAIVHVVAATALGYVAALHLPGAIGIDPRWGAAGLTAAGSAGAWIEYWLLRRSLNRRIGRTGLPAAYIARLVLAAAIASAAGWGVRLAIGPRHPVIAGAAILGAFGVAYVAAAALAGVGEARSLRRFRK